MDNTPNLELPLLANKQALRSTFHDDALKGLDTLVMLSAIDRDLSSPPVSPADGDRYIVKAPGLGDPAWLDDHVVVYLDGGWRAHEPQAGWTCYVQDESLLIVWDGASWQPAVDVTGGGSELQNISLMGVGTTADGTNPLSAKLNNALWIAKTVAEGGNGDLRYKLSKESAAKTLSLLLQDNFSGRAEIGLTGDDDIHFKVSPDGAAWFDALQISGVDGATKLNGGFFLTGALSPSQITADQDDYNPAGLAEASVLRLSSDAARNLTGLSGGGGGRVIALVNAGANQIVLNNASTSSSAANRFAFDADITLDANESALLWYDGTDSRWKLVAGPGAAGGGGGGGDVTGPGSSTDNAVVRFNGTSGTSIQNSGISISDGNLLAGALFGNADLKLQDADASHTLTVTPGSNLTANRVFTLATGDAARTLDISAGNVTVTAAGAALVDDADAAAQRTTLGLGTADSPQFAAVNLGHASDTTLSRIAAGVAAIEGSNILLASGLGSITQAADADTLKADVSDDLTAGFTSTSIDQGTQSSGTFTPSLATGNVQHFTNGGAFTLAPPTGHGSLVLDQTNNASAGAITRTGFTKVTGDSLTTTNGQKFRHFITVGNAGSHCHSQAMQ